VIDLIVYCIPPTQLYECIAINCSLKLKITTCFDPLCDHHQVNTGTYMCILNYKLLPNIWDHILSFNIRQTQEYTNQLTHISLCIIEFIGRTMSLHASAHGTIFRRYINNLTLLNYALLKIKAHYIVLIHNRMHSLKIWDHIYN
jgi:hypothetical protein